MLAVIPLKYVGAQLHDSHVYSPSLAGPWKGGFTNSALAQVIGQVHPWTTSKHGSQYTYFHTRTIVASEAQQNWSSKQKQCGCRPGTQPNPWLPLNVHEYTLPDPAGTSKLCSPAKITLGPTGCLTNNASLSEPQCSNHLQAQAEVELNQGSGLRCLPRPCSSRTCTRVNNQNVVADLSSSQTPLAARNRVSFL